MLDWFGFALRCRLRVFWFLEISGFWVVCVCFVGCYIGGFPVFVLGGVCLTCVECGFWVDFLVCVVFDVLCVVGLCVWCLG